MEHGDQLLSTDSMILDDVPLERLETEITGFASRLAAATARWLIWIAAYDRREGWRTWETKSCAHWLNWHCGVSPRTAHEHVQVAHTLEAFPYCGKSSSRANSPIRKSALWLGWWSL